MEMTLQSFTIDSTRRILEKTEQKKSEVGSVWCELRAENAVCSVCRLPLEEPITYDGQEEFRETFNPQTALVFRCGHAFHAVCIPEAACLTCWTLRRASTGMGVAAVH